MSRATFSVFRNFFFLMISRSEVARLYRPRLATESCGFPPTTWMTSTGEFQWCFFMNSTIMFFNTKESLKFLNYNNMQPVTWWKIGTNIRRRLNDWTSFRSNSVRYTTGYTKNHFPFYSGVLTEVFNVQWLLLIYLHEDRQHANL